MLILCMTVIVRFVHYLLPFVCYYYLFLSFVYNRTVLYTSRLVYIYTPYQIGA